MNESVINSAIGGAITVAFLVFVVWIVRLLWRAVTNAIRAVPDRVEDVARAAGKATTQAERVARSAVRAFKEGRKTEQ